MGPEDVVAGFIPVNKKTVDILGGLEDVEAIIEEKRNALRRGVLPPQRTFWTTEQYREVATRLLQGKDTTAGPPGVIMMNVQPTEKVWEIWRKLEDIILAMGARVPEWVGKLEFEGKKMVERRTLKSQGIKKPSVLAVQWAGDEGVRGTLHANILKGSVVNPEVVTQARPGADRVVECRLSKAGTRAFSVGCGIEPLSKQLTRNLDQGASGMRGGVEP